MSLKCKNCGIYSNSINSLGVEKIHTKTVNYKQTVKFNKTKCLYIDISKLNQSVV